MTHAILTNLLIKVLKLPHHLEVYEFVQGKSLYLRSAGVLDQAINNMY